MKKYDISLNKDIDTTTTIKNKINDVLCPLLELYNPRNHSDLYYIKIYINSSASVILKWVMPFRKIDATSYLIYVYLHQDDIYSTDEMMISTAISDGIDQLSVVSESLAEIVAEFIDLPTCDSIPIVSNLDSETARERRGFVKLKLSKFESDNEKIFTNFIYYLGQKMNERINYALIRLDLCINPGTVEELTGTYEIMIHCSNAFDRLTYDALFNFPQMDLDPIYGNSFEELVEGLHNMFHMLMTFTDACINDDTFEISYYILKEEVAH